VEPPARSAYLGSFDELEARVVIEILSARGVRAFLKHDPARGESAPYPSMSDSGVVLVDSAHLQEARRIVTEELPAHLEGIRQAMDLLESGSSPDDATSGDGLPE